jgi:hypothetical protein
MAPSATKAFTRSYMNRLRGVIDAMTPDKAAPDPRFLAKHSIEYTVAPPESEVPRRAEIEAGSKYLDEEWWTKTQDMSRDDVGWLAVFEHGATLLRDDALPDIFEHSYPEAPVLVQVPGDDTWQAFLADGAREQQCWAMYSTLEPNDMDPEVLGCTLADNKTHNF